MDPLLVTEPATQHVCKATFIFDLEKIRGRTASIYTYKLGAFDKIAVILEANIDIDLETPAFIAEIFPGEIHTPELKRSEDQAFIPDTHSAAQRSI